jgi:hypothetical protein
LARTIAQLAQRQADLLAELAEIRAEIAARAGESDKPPVKRTLTKAAK